MTDTEFNKLMSMQKHIDDAKIELPLAGEIGKPITVFSDTTTDIFIIDSDRRSTISLEKKKLQERHMNTQERLIRLEIDARPHTNPDGTILSRNHIHVFKEGFGLSYAYDLDSFDGNLFKDLTSFEQVFYDFCEYCNIKYDETEIQGVI
ncbi:MAG: hypothetical protein KHY81_00360 [Lachnospiraceae bacterium]|jgi:hypothetical protein|uniref:DUF6978 family protein n=1 Tax=Eubacterium ramulus TaxID=39490 RepID=UPI001E1349E8|nr:hypothetical protein [Eubacterium ramulus]MBS5189898.1 hypothetical protein [Lachnospiraceae bacterium]